MQKNTWTVSATIGVGMLLLNSVGAVGSAQKAAVNQSGTSTTRPSHSYAVICTEDPIEKDSVFDGTSKPFSCSINDGDGGGSDSSDPNASGYPPVDCSNQSNATVANCYPQATGGDPRIPVAGGPGSGGGSRQRACLQAFEQAELACNQKGGDVATCKNAAQARQQSCMAAANSAAQHNQPGTIGKDPNGTSMPSTSSCQVFLAQNRTYCAGLTKTAGVAASQACLAKAQQADNMCNNDASKARTPSPH